MKNTHYFLGILIITVANACTPDQLLEQNQSHANIHETPEDQEIIPGTGDDQSQEPDNEKDG